MSVTDFWCCWLFSDIEKADGIVSSLMYLSLHLLLISVLNQELSARLLHDYYWYTGHDSFAPSSPNGPEMSMMEDSTNASVWSQSAVGATHRQAATWMVSIWLAEEIHPGADRTMLLTEIVQMNVVGFTGMDLNISLCGNLTVVIEIWYFIADPVIYEKG